MDIIHRLCKHKDRDHKMQRLYKRVNGKFIPVGWICPDCGQMKKNTPELHPAFQLAVLWAYGGNGCRE